MSYTPTTPFNQRRGCCLDETWTPSTFTSLNESSEMSYLESDQHNDDPSTGLQYMHKQSC